MSQNPTKIVSNFITRIYSSPKDVTITTRQAEKFAQRLNRVCGQDDLDTGIARVVDLAKVRMEQANPSVYIANIGSSGSHWLQALLSNAASLMPCGETYFPEAQLNQLHEDVEIRKLFIHAIYLIRGWRSTADKTKAGAVNTAHQPFLSHVKAADTGAKSILLVRDPVDVVMSRTFRKDEYRDYTGNRDMTDMEYLKKNALYVRSFYRKALRHNYDITVSYEGIRKNGSNVVAEVFEAIDLSVDMDRIKEVVAQLHSKSTYGSKAAPPEKEYLAAAQFITAEVRSALGYI